MGFFFGKKKSDPSQPNPSWPWALNVSGEQWPNFDTWEMVVSELRELNLEDPDSFLILEQKDPGDPKNYWFIQSAMNRAGPRPGWYTVEIGWGSRQGMALWDKDVRTVEEVIPYFRTAYDRRPVDRSGFEDMSDMLG